MKTAILLLAFTAVSCSSLTKQDPQREVCEKLSSCSSCLSKSYCAWRITRNKCTKQCYSNDNVIYPTRIRALMSGPEFCPRVLRPEKEITFPSGEKQDFVLKLTQIHVRMAFAIWYCKINFNGEETIVNAMLVADEVYCDSVELSNKSDKPVEGSVSVLWDVNKPLDGSLPFIVTL